MELILGYWQVELPPLEQEKCAIIKSNGLYQPTFCLQALCIALPTFQQIMDNVLSYLKFLCVLIYLDKITIFRYFKVQQKQDLKILLNILKQIQLYIKTSKCQEYEKSSSLLGHVISSSGIKLETEKIKAIVELEQSSNFTGIKLFFDL